jgi:hypothetical protein
MAVGFDPDPPQAAAIATVATSATAVTNDLDDIPTLSYSRDAEVAATQGKNRPSDHSRKIAVNTPTSEAVKIPAIRYAV